MRACIHASCPAAPHRRGSSTAALRHTRTLAHLATPAMARSRLLRYNGVSAVPKRGDHHMPTYISLLSWTEQGIKSYKETLDRAKAAEGVAASLGGSLKETYWTL